MKKTKLRNISLALIAVSVLLGAIGCVGGLFWSFHALESAENQGIGPVGDGLTIALASLAVGGIGAIVSGGLLIYSAVRRDS
jgi:hypothetical protein